MKNFLKFTFLIINNNYETTMIGIANIGWRYLKGILKIDVIRKINLIEKSNISKKQTIKLCI